MEAQQGYNLNMKWYLLILSMTITIDVYEIYSHPCPCVLESIPYYKPVYIMPDGHRQFTVSFTNKADLHDK